MGPGAGVGTRNAAAFWLLGLLNNAGKPLWPKSFPREVQLCISSDGLAAYVVMLSGATEISAGAVGLVYLCAILPSLTVKLTGPYWCVAYWYPVSRLKF